jgi:hypothetical protein
MMKKVFYLALTLIVLSAAGANAQVRIGGLTNPDESAVLDLNPDAGTGALGLALPRVELVSTTSFAPLKSHVAGMTVYNTVAIGDVAPGAYFNDGGKWIRIGAGTLSTAIVEVDSIVGNEVTDATEDGGLLRAGSGTAAEPYTLNIANKGVTTARLDDRAVTTAKIADEAITSAQITAGAVTAAKLNDMGAANGQVLSFNGSAWAPGSVGTLGLLADGSPATTRIYMLNASTCSIDNSTWTPSQGYIQWGTTKIAEFLAYGMGIINDYSYWGAVSTTCCVNGDGSITVSNASGAIFGLKWVLIKVWVVD